MERDTNEEDAEEQNMTVYVAKSFDYDVSEGTCRSIQIGLYHNVDDARMACYEWWASNDAFHGIEWDENTRGYDGIISEEESLYVEVREEEVQ